jgi:hypothetical protein
MVNLFIAIMDGQISLCSNGTGAFATGRQVTKKLSEQARAYFPGWARNQGKLSRKILRSQTLSSKQIPGRAWCFADQNKNGTAIVFNQNVDFAGRMLNKMPSGVDDGARCAEQLVFCITKHKTTAASK